MEDALKARRRPVVQFGRLATLARTIRDCDLSKAEGDLLVEAFEDVADRDELGASFDLEALEDLLNRLRQDRQAKQVDQGEREDLLVEVFITLSTSTKH